MYNQQGIFTIGSDMCYVNKIMQDETIPRNCTAETTLKNQDAEEGLVYNRPMQPKARKKRKFDYTYLLNSIYSFLALGFILGVELAYIPGRTSGFYCKDPKISHNFHGDTISTASLLITSLGMPIFVFALNEGLRFGCYSKRFLGRTLRWFYIYMVFITVLLVIIQACKIFAGELRPHFLTSCQPDAAMNCSEGQFITEYNCTNRDFSRMFLVDSARSFPSGHASLSMYATVFTAIYIHYELKTAKLGSLFKPFLLSLVCIWGPFVSFSRVLDYRHFWWDVAIGAILGVTFGVYAMFSVSDKFTDYKMKSRPKSLLENSSTTALYQTNPHNVNNSL